MRLKYCLFNRKTDKNIVSISFNINQMVETAQKMQKEIEKAKKQREEARKQRLRQRQLKRQQSAGKPAAIPQKPAVQAQPAPAGKQNTAPAVVPAPAESAK